MYIKFAKLTRLRQAQADSTRQSCQRSIPAAIDKPSLRAINF